MTSHHHRSRSGEQQAGNRSAVAALMHDVTDDVIDQLTEIVESSGHQQDDPDNDIEVGGTEVTTGAAGAAERAMVETRRGSVLSSVGFIAKSVLVSESLRLFGSYHVSCSRGFLW